MKQIYLAGASKNVTTEEKAFWRELIEEKLFYSTDFEKLKVINPVKYFDYDKPESFKSNKQVKSFYLNQVRNSDIVIVNLDHSDESVGTGIECETAVNCGIPVIGFGVNKDTWYPWTEECCEVIFQSIDEVFCYIRDFYFRGL